MLPADVIERGKTDRTYYGNVIQDMIDSSFFHRNDIVAFKFVKSATNVMTRRSNSNNAAAAK
jgi:hypothetical protein